MQIEVTGQSALSAKLTAAAQAVGDFKDEFVEVGNVLKTFYETVPFESQGAIYGRRWAGLKTSTKKVKQRKYPGKGVLVASGAMRDSFTYVASPVSVVITNTSNLFKYHQLGTGDKGSAQVPPDHPGRGLNLPQRVMMLFDATRQQMAISAVEKILVPKINAAFKEQ